MLEHGAPCPSPAQVEVGVLTREEADSCVSVEFNPVRAGFAGGEEVWTRDVLNLGVSPAGVICLVGSFGGQELTGARA